MMRWICVLGLTVLVVGAFSSTASAQTIPSLNDLQDLLNGGNTGTGDTGTGDTGTGDTGAQAATEGGRTPIITNQFNAHRGASLVARRPGLQIQQAVAVGQGDASTFTNTTRVDEPSFQLRAFEEFTLGWVDSILNNLGSINTLSSVIGLLNFNNIFTDLFEGIGQTPNQQDNVGVIENPTTDGQGTVEPIQ